MKHDITAFGICILTMAASAIATLLIWHYKVAIWALAEMWGWL